nr:fimbria/pilus outer membrane usher protein [Thauera sp. K11]
MNAQLDERAAYSMAVGTTGAESGRGEAMISGTYRADAARIGGALAISDGRRSTTVSAGGGVVLHEGGLGFTANRVTDTFAVVSTPRVAGVQIRSPAGSLTTDGNGDAVVPSMAPFGRSLLSIDPASLPGNVDYQGGVTEVQVARGSVARIVLPTVQVVRVMFHVRGASGLRAGDEVLGPDASLVALMEDGERFVVEDYKAQPLTIKAASGAVCRIAPADVVPDPGAFYTRVEVACGG